MKMNTNFLDIVKENEIFDMFIQDRIYKCYMNQTGIYLNESNIVLYKPKYVKCECCWLKENHLSIFCCEEDHFNNNYNTLNCVKIIDFLKCRDCNKICCYRCVKTIFEYNGIKTIHINKKLNDIFTIGTLIRKNIKHCSVVCINCYNNYLKYNYIKIRIIDKNINKKSYLLLQNFNNHIRK